MSIESNCLLGKSAVTAPWLCTAVYGRSVQVPLYHFPVPTGSFQTKPDEAYISDKSPQVMYPCVYQLRANYYIDRDLDNPLAPRHAYMRHLTLLLNTIYLIQNATIH